MHAKKTVIEEKLGVELDWERHDDKKECRIAWYKRGVDVTDETKWDEISDFMGNNIKSFTNALKPVLDSYFVSGEDATM